MKAVVTIIASLLVGSLLGASVSASKPPATGSAWRLVYAHNTDEDTSTGSKEELMGAVRAGKEVRVYWASGRVEHAADAALLTIFGDEVFAQVPIVRAQAPSKTTNPPMIALRDEGQEWTAVFATNGDLALKWFVRD